MKYPDLWETPDAGEKIGLILRAACKAEKRRLQILNEKEALKEVKGFQDLLLDNFYDDVTKHINERRKQDAIRSDEIPSKAEIKKHARNLHKLVSDAV